MGKPPFLCLFIIVILGILFLITFIPPAAAQNDYSAGWEPDIGTMLTNFIADPIGGFFEPFPILEWNGNQWKTYADANAAKCKQYSDLFYDQSYSIYLSTIVPKYNISKDGTMSKSYFKTNLFANSENTVASEILNTNGQLKQYLSQSSYYCSRSANAYDMAMGKTSDSNHSLKAEIFSDAADVYRTMGRNSDANKLDAAAAEQTAEAMSSFGLPLPPWIIVVAVVGAVVLLQQKKSKI